MSVLRASVSDGERGLVITLSGEADVTTAAELSELMTAQLSGGARHLVIDAAGLAFADSATVHILLDAAKALRDRGGGLVLLSPQSTVAAVLRLTGASELIAIQDELSDEPES